MLAQLSLFGFSEESNDAATAPCEYQVRRNARTRRLSLSVMPSGRVEVLAPRKASDRQIRRFVAQNTDWIESTRDAFAKRFGKSDTALPTMMNLEAIDHYAEVRYVPEQGDGVRISGSHTITVRGNLNDESAVRDALKRWLARVAKKEFAARLSALAEETGLTFKRVQVRAQRSCWGSHSSSGTISLNYCLAFLEPEQLRYVLIHELCHGPHMDHSRSFWKLVRSFEPAYRRIDRSLDSAWKQLPGWLELY